MYPIGTLKVVWVEDDVNYLSSDMFKPNQITEAVLYGKKQGDFMIMELVSQEKDLYRWKVLPYGKYKEYFKGVGISKKFRKLFGNESGYTSPNGQIFTSKEAYYTQLVRVADVFVIGPVLIFASTFKTLPSYLRVVLFLIGVSTIIYNGKNYLKEIK
jgi:hypothetical protein